MRRSIGAKRLWAGGLVLVAMSGAGAARAQQPDPAGSVETHAEAHRRLPNTVSDVSVGIELHERGVPETSAQLARRSRALLDYLRGEHADRLRTEQVSVDPETAQLPGQPVRVTGYLGRATVSFRTIPDRLPVLLAGCLDHGASTLQQSGSSPSEEEVETARQALAAEAAHAALAEATVVAKALGEHVAGVQRAEVDPMAGPVRPMIGMMAMAKASAPIQVEAGDADIVVTVRLTVRILPGLS